MMAHYTLVATSEHSLSEMGHSIYYSDLAGTMTTCIYAANSVCLNTQKLITDGCLRGTAGRSQTPIFKNAVGIDNDHDYKCNYTTL